MQSDHLDCHTIEMQPEPLGSSLGRNFRVFIGPDAPTKEDWKSGRLAGVEKSTTLGNLQSAKLYFGKIVTQDSIECDLEMSELLREAQPLVEEGAKRHENQSLNQHVVSFGMPKFHGIFDLTQDETTERIAIYDYVDGIHISPNILDVPDTAQVDQPSARLRSFFSLASALCRLVQLLHNQGLVHSLISRRHLLLEKRETDPDKIWLVGFGYANAYDTKTRHRSGTSDSDKLFLAPECHNQEDHTAPWTTSDIYSIGAVLYWLLVSDPKDENAHMSILKAPPRDVEILKRDISDAIKVAQPDLFKLNENLTKILDTCLRYSPEERFSCIEELQEWLRTAESAKGSSSAKNDPIGDDIRTRFIENFLRKMEKFQSKTVQSEKSPTRLTGSLKPDYFVAHLDAEFAKLSDLAGRLTRDSGSKGHFEIYGNRDLIVGSLCKMLASARGGDVYCTMTLPNYWSDANLGSNGRFLTMNKHMARKGVVIRRLFLVSTSFQELQEEEQRILQWQLRAQKDLQKEMASRRSPHFPNLQIKVAKVGPEKVALFERSGSMVAYLGPENPDGSVETRDTICLNFHSITRSEWIYGKPVVNRLIQKLRYWTPLRAEKRFLRSRELFLWEWSKADYLDTYMLPDAVRAHDIQQKEHPQATSPSGSAYLSGILAPTLDMDNPDRL